MSQLFAAPPTARNGNVLPQAKRVRPGDVLTDSRFAAMFENRDFEVDLDADEYKQLHPNAGAHSHNQQLHPDAGELQTDVPDALCSSAAGCTLYVCDHSNMSHLNGMFKRCQGEYADFLSRCQPAVQRTYWCVLGRRLTCCKRAPAEGRAKERRLIREHFQQVSDGEADPDGAVSSGSEEDAGPSSSEEEAVSSSHSSHALTRCLLLLRPLLLLLLRR